MEDMTYTETALVLLFLAIGAGGLIWQAVSGWMRGDE